MFRFQKQDVYLLLLPTRAHHLVHVSCNRNTTHANVTLRYVHYLIDKQAITDPLPSSTLRLGMVLVLNGRYRFAIDGSAINALEGNIKMTNLLNIDIDCAIP